MFKQGITMRVVLSVLLVISALLTSYSGWGYHRLTWGILDFAEHQRPVPYPDQLILWLNDWYDRRYPVEPGYFKLHGELDRVRLTFLAVLVPSALASLTLLQLVLAPWLFPKKKPSTKSST
jgi:hypothetical protein